MPGIFSAELSKKNKIQSNNVKLMVAKFRRSDALWQQNGRTPTSNHSQN
jgi:hypothetical protein